MTIHDSRRSDTDWNVRAAGFVRDTERTPAFGVLLRHVMELMSGPRCKRGATHPSSCEAAGFPQFFAASVKHGSGSPLVVCGGVGI